MATIVVQNKSGRSIDNVMVWHSADTPPTPTPSNASLAQNNVPNGGTATAGVSTDDAFDWWACGVLFEGDGTVYVMCGDTSSAYKEYSVSDDHTITFVVNAYMSSGPYQSQMDLLDNGGDDQNALLISSSFLNDVEIAGIIAHILE